MFEARYESELFLTDELLSRGGASSPEDHLRLERLMAAYQASVDAEYDSSQDMPDPWALDTQPEAFETTPEVPAPSTTTDLLPDSSSSANEKDPIRPESCARRPREFAKDCVRRLQRSPMNESRCDGQSVALWKS